MDCQAAEETDDETSVIEPKKTAQQSLNKEMEGIKSVTSTEEEQMREQIFKDKESEPITYEEEDFEEENLHTYAQDTQEYMHWHYRLNHPTHTVMTRMAKLKMLPKEITRILKTMVKQ
jgi:hypothetical protein